MFLKCTMHKTQGCKELGCSHNDTKNFINFIENCFRFSCRLEMEQIGVSFVLHCNHANCSSFFNLRSIPL